MTIFAPDSRRNNFDFLRFLFASLVLLYHCFPLLLGPKAEGAAAQWAAQAGGTSVDFFFVISGFLVTASWERRPQAGSYLRKRALRIYPGFVLASFFGAFVIGPLGADQAGAYWHQFHTLKFVLYLFLLPADVIGPDMTLVFAHQPYAGVINGSFWTLRYEFEMYLVVIALGMLGLYRPRTRFVIAWLFGLLYVLFVLSQVTGGGFIPSGEIAWIGSPVKWLRLLTCFFAGMTFYVWRERIPFSLPLLGIACTVLLSAALTGRGLNAAMLLFGAYALFYLAFAPWVRLGRFARYGDFSYGVYLYAFPIQQWLVREFGPELTPMRLFFAAFPLTVLCALVSWRLVEQPALRWKKAMVRENPAGKPS